MSPAERKTRFVIVAKAACMPSGCWGTYKRVAVLEIEIGAPLPKMISERARGVVRVVRTWERLSVGLTERCAYQRALTEAIELARTLDPVGYDAADTARRLVAKEGAS